MSSLHRFGIFISSVQKELATERRAVKDYVEGDPLLRQFFDVFMFEDLPASGRRADKVYLAEVERCDIYLGLFGNEYGFEDTEGISPTEREFRAATAAGKERIVMLKGPDDISRHAKMRALVRKAGKQVIRRRFSSVSELTGALYASLVEYLGRHGIVQSGPFEANACSGAGLADLDSQAIVMFVRRARAERSFPLAEDTVVRNILAHLNLLVGDSPSRAAILLFGREPQRWLPSAEIRCMHFHGTEVARPVPYYQIFKGNIFNQVDLATNFVLSVINRSVGTRAESSQAPVAYELPPDVVREAIVNAIVHRDYASSAAVQVSVFADRVEVRNPGGLTPPLTPASLRLPHSSITRNHRLCEVLFLARYIEKFGTGTLMMIRESLAHALPEPDFQVSDGEFVITLWRDWLTEKLLTKLQLNQRQVRAVITVKTAGSITNTTYQQTAGASRPTAIRDLADLVSKGIFARHGAGRSAYYTLAVKRLRNDSNDSAKRSVAIDSETTQSTRRIQVTKTPKSRQSGKQESREMLPKQDKNRTKRSAAKSKGARKDPKRPRGGNS